MTASKLTSALAVAFLLLGGAAANAADTYPEKSTTQQTAAMKPRSAESIECSKEADAKGLHGKVRKDFRANCKAALKAGKPVPEPKGT